jgi:hypothetical protein
VVGTVPAASFSFGGFMAISEASFTQDGRKRNPGGEIVDMVALKESLSSNRITRYTTIRWADDKLSCNCPGWAFKKSDGRKCKHTKASLACECSDMATIGDFEVAPLVGNTGGTAVITPSIQEVALMSDRTRQHRGINLTRRRQ